MFPLSNIILKLYLIKFVFNVSESQVFHTYRTVLHTYPFFFCEVDHAGKFIFDVVVNSWQLQINCYIFLVFILYYILYFALHRAR